MKPMKKGMKQAGAVLTALMLVCGLAACGGSGKDRERESGTAGGGTSGYRDFMQDGSSEDSEQSGSRDGGSDRETEAGQGSETDSKSETGQSGTGEDGEADGASGGRQNGAAGSEAGEDGGSDGGSEAGQEAPTREDYDFSSDDWKTLEFALDGTVYSFPLTWADVEAMGYQLEEAYREEELKPYYYTMVGVDVKNEEAGKQIRVLFKNFAEETRKIPDCDIYRIAFELFSWRDVNVNIMLCNGVTFGMTPEEVIAIMGEPENAGGDEEVDYSYGKMDYVDQGEDYKNSVTIEFWDGAVDGITITDGR
ncbi:MAG: hypothetical protein NC123_02815 [Butyrivibrio sp.]|nr:hypothetical protein [Acetatifactor muris]MCM1558473.1 hypothetical protein [Butyrivibrio sp.]